MTPGSYQADVTLHRPLQLRRFNRWTVQTHFALAMIGVAILVRLALVAFTDGTSDAQALHRFGSLTAQFGYLGALQRDSDLNFPPIGMYIAAISWRVAQTFEVGFPQIFKLWMVLADVLAVALVWRIGSQMAGQRFGRSAAVLLAWNPLAMILSGYHCNLDPVYAALCLLAVERLLRQRYLASGLVLGLAINIKLIPVMLIIPILLQCRAKGHILRYLSGLAVMAVPSVIAIVIAPETFIRQVVMYRSLLSDWGINYILLQLMHSPDFSARFDRVVVAYSQAGTCLVLLSILLISLRLHRTGKPLPLQAAALGAICFLLLTPGFGVQYLAFVIPLIALLLPRLTLAFGIIGAAAMGLGIVQDNHLAFSPHVLNGCWMILWVCLARILGHQRVRGIWVWHSERTQPGRARSVSQKQSEALVQNC